MTVTENKAIMSPIDIGKLTLQHRVVMAPLTRLRSTIEGVPTDLQVQYYEQRASQGGLILTECAAISPTALGYPQGPGIFSNAQIAGWKKVTDAVHQKGGYIYIQLWHSGRTGKRVLHPNNEQVVSASAITAMGKDILDEAFEDPKALEVAEIQEITQDFKQAAINAVNKAGFDGVEIHTAFGYLLDQFINTSSNQRTDEYGGSIENRCRFTLEVTEAIVEAIGAERTGIRVSPEGGAFHSATEEFPVKTISYLISQLQQRWPKLTYVHFMQQRTADNMEEDYAAVYRFLWEGPVISSGFSSSLSMEHATNHAEKTGDLIAFGRTFISNPDLPERIRQGYSLNKADYSTFYTHGAQGYVDYPSVSS
jgi:2,4-dienoyl-CoA reductase-like NADH-dependent reductase (Old Yellow Enzyme family)